jgi:hypothetical protein
MPYNVNYTNTTKAAISVSDGTINATTQLSLVGKNFYNYGEYIAENFLHLLENHAQATDPSTATAVQGQIYYNTTSDEYKYFNGTSWSGLPAGGSKNAVVKDNADVDKSVSITTVGGVIISVTSNNQPFTLSTTALGDTATLYAIWGATQIAKGINLNPTSAVAGSDAIKLHGIATQAQYADVAEMYTSDADYEPGTVVKIGGEAEVTQTTDGFCPEVFGIVSTDPAYLMNSGTEGVAIALEGRVPCKVIGPVRKGQRLVSSETPGVARAVSDYEHQEALDWYRIVGRALADKTSESVGLLEVVVGTK